MRKRYIVGGSGSSGFDGELGLSVGGGVGGDTGCTGTMAGVSALRCSSR